MKLVLLGQGRWTVYAICTDETTCPLLDLIASLDSKRGAKVLSDLREFVPTSQPRDWVRMDFSWKLRGTEIVLEFRWPTRSGPTPRAYWFYDEGAVVVCTHGVLKKGNTDPQDIKAAEQIYVRYIAAKKAGQLTVVAFEDFDPPNEEEGSDG